MSTGTSMEQEFFIHDSLAEHYAAMGVTVGEGDGCAVHRLEQLQPRWPYTSPLFRVNYYSIVFVREGRGFYIIDSDRYPLRPGSLFFSNPGHIKGYGTHELVSGFVIAFSEAFLKRYARETILDECAFLIAEVAPPHSVSGDTFRLFDELGARMCDESEGTSPHRLTILGSLITIMLFKIKERFWADYDPLTESDGETRIVRTFKHDLEAHYRALAAETDRGLYQVQDYAAAQRLHPNYFSAVIKRKTGKSVKIWIAEKTVTEAQAQLARSHAPIQRIAYRLGFSDAAHFSRFFKHRTGTSPSAFRRTVRDA
ncbi:MAG: AraC family transcriptional regulator [Spirochaetales bacterium]|nr:AraC family transcriptional regulator [Spirochaetales bacterium]